MKNLIPIILLLMSLNITAQQNKRERIKALKVSFITEKLDLSEKEAQEFWPVYNAFEKKYNALRHDDSKAIRKEIRDSIETLTDSKANELIAKINKAETEMHKTKMEFAKNLANILPPKKIILLKISEEDFKRKMFEEYKKRKKGKN